MGSQKPLVQALLKDKEAWAIIRMTGKRLTGFENPVNPVILSKRWIETRQTCAATKAWNATR
jgi:hypothetical protein